MGLATEVRHGTERPATLRKSHIFIQHDPDSEKILGVWAGNKNDQRRVVQPLAVRHKTAAYQILAEDKYVGGDSSGGAFTLTLPDPADINDGHSVIIDDEGGAAGTNAITIATPGSETVEGAASGSIATNGARQVLVWDEANTNWVDVS